MKILDRYILKSFFTPFIATFLIVVFILVMQAVWLAFDDIAGKGIDLIFILKFLGYLTLVVTPMAFPIAILLSSIMTLGNLSENYELASIKSAGISLRRTLLPLIITAFLLSGLNFIFLNNVYPWATLKQKNLYYNIRKKQPALALIPGQFNTDIPGYTIKFDEKYGEEKNLLKNVQISDLSASRGKIKIITAKKGEITSKEGSKYLTFNLYDGRYYEEHIVDYQKKKRMPASKGTFQKYIVNMDISALDNNKDLDDENIKEHYAMLTVSQLGQKSKERKVEYDKLIKYKSDFLETLVKSKFLYPAKNASSIEKMSDTILKNYHLNTQPMVLNQSIELIDRAIQKQQNEKKNFKDNRKWLNLYDFERNHRIAFALACLVLFFIGAPLGSIIRKGGFGLPMVLAIVVFVIYYFINQFSKNLSEESAMTAQLGSWMSTLILLPIGIYLTRMATKGKMFAGFKGFTNKIVTLLKRQKK
ncbi:MAG: LptF/LptG family permease [Flavobacteriaceae bacterium]|nr:LptF/LptG family permease [Flavobacteriaceae bacterium]